MKVLYTDIPKPAKFKQINSISKPKIEPKTESKIQELIEEDEITELIIGGDLEPEPPKVQDAGNCTIEEMDYSDYQ